MYVMPVHAVVPATAHCMITRGSQCTGSPAIGTARVPASSAICRHVFSLLISVGLISALGMLGSKYWGQLNGFGRDLYRTRKPDARRPTSLRRTRPARGTTGHEGRVPGGGTREKASVGERADKRAHQQLVADRVQNAAQGALLLPPPGQVAIDLPLCNGASAEPGYKVAEAAVDKAAEGQLVLGVEHGRGDQRGR